MSSPTITVRMDTSGAAFGAAPTWTDYTTSVMDADGVTITWGAQDEISEPTARTCSFLLKNDTGVFTPGNAGAPAGWDIGTRVNIRVTVSGTPYDRFDGYVDSIEPTWPNGVQSWNVVKVTCTDVTARLAVGHPLRSLIEQEMLADNPVYLFPLDEASGSVAAGDISGNRCRAAYRVDGKYGAGSVSFGTDLGLPDSATGVAFSSTDTPGTMPGKVSCLAISNNDGGPVAAGAHAVECVAIIPDTLPSGVTSEFLLNQNGGPFAAGNTHGARLFYSYDGTVSYSAFGESGFATASAAVTPGLHVFAGTLEADLKTVNLYVDGVLVATAVSAATIDVSGLTRNHIGGNLSVTSSQIGGQFQGTIGLVAMYPTALSAARILAHYQAGFGALLERSDQRFSRLAGYANVTTSGLPTGLATIGHQNTKGKSVTDGLAAVARTEGTTAFTTGAGAETFQARNVRYTPASTLSLTASDIFGAPVFRRDRQGFANEYTATRDGGAAQKAIDATSQTTYGRFDGGSLEVCPSTDYDALQNAAWKVALHKTPQTRVASITVNLYAQTNATTVANVLNAGPSTQLTVSSLPSQAPASSVSLFIEGGTEKISLTEWWVQFFTSPPLPFSTLRADGSPSSRTKLDNGLKIPF